MSLVSDLSPVVLFVYNRPEHTRRTVEALAANEMAAESDLFIYADGSKKPEHADAVRKVREYIRSIGGFRSMTIVERQENWGLARSVITGVTELVNRFGRIIVLEDDLIVSPYFLKYMNDALKLYQNEEQVMQISGYMFDTDLKSSDSDAIFLSFAASWGWATWQRAWKYFSPSLEGHERLKKDAALKNKFNLDGHYQYFDMLEKQLRGEIDSWAIIWNLNVFMKNGLVLFPTRSLVSNIGFDGSGRHCKDIGRQQNAIFTTYNKFIYPVIIKESTFKTDVYEAIYKLNSKNTWIGLKNYIARIMKLRIK